MCKKPIQGPMCLEKKVDGGIKTEPSSSTSGMALGLLSSESSWCRGCFVIRWRQGPRRPTRQGRGATGGGWRALLSSAGRCKRFLRPRMRRQGRRGGRPRRQTGNADCRLWRPPRRIDALRLHILRYLHIGVVEPRLANIVLVILVIFDFQD